MNAENLVRKAEPQAQISMREFFSLPEVLDQQAIQKANPFNSPAHRKATAEIVRIADRHNCEEYFQ